MRDFFRIYKQKKAFTLAEVLITLAVIGIVAALTLPTLIKNYQKQVYVTNLKKAYAELSQVFKLYIADEGVTDLSQTSLFSTDNNYTKLNEILNKYFKVAQLCYSSHALCKLTESNLDPAKGNFSTFDSYSAIYTVNGIAFQFYLDSSASCKPDYDNPSNMKGLCLEIGVDTNGAKPPNTRGRDYFEGLRIGPDGSVFPNDSREYAQWDKYYTTGSITGWNWSYYWKANSTWCGTEGSSDIPSGTYGYGCSARIRDEGWKMSY